MSLWFGTARTEGTIVGEERQWGARSGYLPVVAYEANGKTYQCKGIVGSDSSRIRRGQRVGVLYATNQPSSGYVDTFFDRWLIPLAFGGVGFVFVGIGYLVVMPEGASGEAKEDD